MSGAGERQLRRNWQEGLGFGFPLLERSIREASRDPDGDRKRDGRFTDQERQKEIETERVGTGRWGGKMRIRKKFKTENNQDSERHSCSAEREAWDGTRKHSILNTCLV